MVRPTYGRRIDRECLNAAGHPLGAEGPRTELRLGLRTAVPPEASGRESSLPPQGKTAHPQGTPSEDETAEGCAERDPAEARTVVPGGAPRRRGDRLCGARARSGTVRRGARQDPHEAARCGRAVQRDGARGGPRPRGGARRRGPTRPESEGGVSSGPFLVDKEFQFIPTGDLQGPQGEGGAREGFDGTAVEGVPPGEK